MKTILLLLLTAPIASAACGQLSTHVWDCPDSGNVYTNGTDLNTLISGHSWACGDTIILYAGVEYRRPDSDAGTYWTLPYQTDCSGNKKLRFVSSRLSEIPLGQKQNLKNYRAMMPLLTTSNYAIWGASGTTAGSNNYSFHGIRHATTSLVVPARGRVSNLFFAATQYDYVCSNANTGKAACQDKHDVIAGFRPRNFEIDRCIFEEYESTAYAEPTISSTDGNSFLHSASIGIYAPWDGLYMHDSYVSLTGYTNTTAESGTTAWTSFTTVTNAEPGVLQLTGILTTLGITYSAGCTTATDNFTTQGAWDTACAGHYARVVIRGATGNWLPLNGPKILRSRADGYVDVLIPDADRATYINLSWFNSSALGAFSGSSQELTQYVLLTQYAIALTFAAQNIRIIDNFLESWAMPIFTGGADGPQYDQAVIQTGSTATSLILNHVRELRVGMMITFNVPVGSGPSSYCHLSPGNGCAGVDYIRTGRVTAISGTTVTIEGWGPDGTDGTTPDIGQVAWWKNDFVQGVEIRGNVLSRGRLHRNGDAGKGVIETKHSDAMLVDGNDMSYNVSGTYFTEAKSQGGTDPNTTVKNTTFSNNLASGLTSAGSVTCLWAPALILQDNEHSIMPGSNVIFEHNVHVGCVAPAGTSFAHPTLAGGSNSAYRHNTYAVGMAQTPTYRFVDQRDCNIFAESYYAEYARVTLGFVRDNIIGYGDGAYMGAPSTAVCWPTISTDIQKNIIVDTESVGTSAINTAYAGNFPVANYTGFWSGACTDYTDWQTCTLHASNPNRGAASDGGDPGADILQVKDRLERWSEKAGLIESGIPSLAFMRNRSGNWTIGSTTAAVRFQLFNSLSSACTVELFTNRNRATAHSDASSAQACNRSSSVTSGNNVAYVFGGSSALTANTEYFYKITDGSRIMVGEFRTQPAGSGAAVSTYRYSSARTGNLCTDAAMTTSCSSISSAATHSVSVPQGALRYYQSAGGAVIPVVAR